MADRIASCRGCLLGMAVGDAMGYTVDEKTWQEICEDYGPNGLMGYDVVNGCAEVSSYTQMGAYVANGLLLALNRGRVDLYMRYIQLSMKEWARRQNLPRDPEKYYCWVSHISNLRRRHCRDSRMLDTLRATTLGTVDAPINKNPNPGSLTAAAMIGLSDPKRVSMERIMELGAGTVASTHGGPEAFLSGAVLATVIADLAQNPEKALQEVFRCAIEAMVMRYQEQFPQASQIAQTMQAALTLQQDDPQQQMEALVCNTAPECVAGAMYACLACEGDFDTAMILAVNHSGRSAAVGALTGAILGVQLTNEAIPEFYLEGLEVVEVLDQLAKDLAQGSPTTGLFDDDWDQKYTQGLPVGHYQES